jgi:uncharacterized membrane protein (DUF485 family)
MTFTRSPARQLTGYEVVHASREFRALKRQFTSFAVPATAAFLAWYFLYVMLATFAPGFMRVPVFGEVNVGLYLGLLQFASTFAITVGYRSWTRRFTPQAARLRARLEEGRDRTPSASEMSS